MPGSGTGYLAGPALVLMTLSEPATFISYQGKARQQCLLFTHVKKILNPYSMTVSETVLLFMHWKTASIGLIMKPELL